MPPKISAFKQMQIKNVLKELGLNERHTAIYLACLELGTASIQKISQKSGFARSTCEAVLKSLQIKGLAISFKKRNTRVFSPEDPKKLLLSAKEKVKILEESLPQFSARYFRGNILPTVSLYQGEEGAKRVLQEILEEAKELKSFGAVDDVYAALGEYFKKFTAERIRRSIPLKVILRDTPLARERQRIGPSELREVRLVPEGYNYSSITFVWGSKVAMFSLKEELVTLVIESDEMEKMHTSTFDFIWDTLGRNNS